MLRGPRTEAYASPALVAMEASLIHWKADVLEVAPPQGQLVPSWVQEENTRAMVFLGEPKSHLNRANTEDPHHTSGRKASLPHDA